MTEKPTCTRILITFVVGVLAPSFVSSAQLVETQVLTGKRWEFEVGDSVAAPLSVDEHGVYFGSKDQYVYALDRQNGKLRWRFSTNGLIRGGAAIREGIVYIGSADHTFYALRANDGTLLWRFSTVGAIMGSPLVTGNRVFFGSNDHHLYCLDRLSGHLQWRYRTGDTVECRPATSLEKVFVGSGDNRIYALDKKTGRLNWVFSCSASVDGGLLVHEGSVYATDRGGFVYAIKENTGNLVWKCNTRGSLEAFPIVGPEGRIFLGGGHKNGRIACINTKGALLWQQDLGGSAFGPVCLASGLIWATSSLGVVAGFDPETGKQLVQINTGAPLLGGIGARDKTLFWADASGRITAWRLGRN